MKWNVGKLCDNALFFFDPKGNAIMKLTPESAIDVCLQAANRGLVIVRIEGGIFSEKGFEARLDAIWDGKDPPLSYEETCENNLRAYLDIKAESELHNAFIITCAPMSGYLHKLNE